MKKTIKLISLSFVLLVGLLLNGCNTVTQTSQTKDNSQSSVPVVGLKIGNLAPDFEITMDDGKKIKLSDLQGKPVFLNFWATWCPYCKDEMPGIQKIFAEGHSVQIIAIDDGEAPMQVRSFITQKGYKFPVGYDLTGEISDLYMATGLPTSYAIDSKGIIRFQIQGATNYNQFSQWFSELEKAE